MDFFGVNVISCHEHETAPDEGNLLWGLRGELTTRFGGGGPKMSMKKLVIPDASMKEALQKNQIRLMDLYGVDLSIFTSRASWSLFPDAPQRVQLEWTRVSNDAVFQACNLFPKRFVPGIWIPPILSGSDVENALEEMERGNLLGAVVCNLNPFPTGTASGNIPLWDEMYKPIFRLAWKLRMTVMIHASCSCVVGSETTADFYLNAMTTAVCQLAVSTVMVDNPNINIVMAQGGGAIPFHLGRMKTLLCYKGKVDWQTVIESLWWDTCLYGDPEMEYYLKRMPLSRILLGLELKGACDGTDEGGYPAEDTNSRIERVGVLTPDQLQDIRLINHGQAYPLLEKWLNKHFGA